MMRDCYIPPDEREWMKVITQAGRDKGYEYGDGATVLGSFVKCLSHLTKAMKIMAGFIPAYTTEELERHIFKCVWWLYRALYLLRKESGKLGEEMWQYGGKVIDGTLCTTGLTARQAQDVKDGKMIYDQDSGTYIDNLGDKQHDNNHDQ